MTYEQIDFGGDLLYKNVLIKRGEKKGNLCIYEERKKHKTIISVIRYDNNIHQLL